MNTSFVFAALLALALAVVVPLTLLNSRSIVQPVARCAADRAGDRPAT